MFLFDGSKLCAQVVDVGTGDVYALKHLRLGAEQDLIKEIQHEGKGASYCNVAIVHSCCWRQAGLCFCGKVRPLFLARMLALHVS